MYQCPKANAPWDGLFKVMDPYPAVVRCECCGMKARPAGGQIATYQGHYSDGLGCYVGSEQDERNAINRIAEESDNATTLVEVGNERAKDRRHEVSKAAAMKAREYNRRDLTRKGIVQGISE